MRILFGGVVVACLFLSAPAARADEGSVFQKGDWTVQVYGAYFDDVTPSDERIASGTAGVGYFFRDDWSINLELAGYDLDARNGGDDAAGGAVNLALRWHFLQRGRFTLFLEGSAGLLYADRKFPPGGTHFNYPLQAGLGATFRLNENVHLLGAFRYLHISNANVHGIDENPSIDSLGGYVGVMFAW